MIRKISLVAIGLIVVFALLAGCAASSVRNSGAQDQDTMVYETTTAAAPAAEMFDGSSVKSIEPGSGGGGATPLPRKIVRNANLGLEVVDVKATYDQLLSYAIARQGYETMRNEYRNEDYLTLNATIRLNPNELDGFLVYAETLGTVINRQISTDDITEGYYDTTTRLATMEKSLARYDEFLERAVTIEEVLQVQNQINQITVEIESLKGRLRLWDSMLDESTITIEIRQVDDPVKIKKEVTWSALTWSDMVYLMRSGLTKFANGFVSVVQWVLIVIVAAAPLWIIALIVLLILRRRRNRKGSKQPKHPEQP